VVFPTPPFPVNKIVLICLRLILHLTGGKDKTAGTRFPRECFSGSIRSASADDRIKSGYSFIDNRVDSQYTLIYKTRENSTPGWKPMRKTFASLKAQRLLLIIVKGYLI
jgi:hypothetical protein